MNFKNANQRQVEEITNRINKVVDKIPTRTFTETNNLIIKASIYVARIGEWLEIWFIDGVDNVNRPPYRDLKADISSVSPSSERIDELWVV